MTWTMELGSDREAAQPSKAPWESRKSCVAFPSCNLRLRNIALRCCGGTHLPGAKHIAMAAGVTDRPRDARLSASRRTASRSSAVYPTKRPSALARRPRVSPHIRQQTEWSVCRRLHPALPGTCTDGHLLRGTQYIYGNILSSSIALSASVRVFAGLPPCGWFSPPMIAQQRASRRKDPR